MISSFISASQKDPKAVMHSFLKELVNNIKYDSLTFTDISKVFPLLTPSTSKSISVKSLSDDFLKISQDIRSAVKYQETANCSACGASRNGLWSVESWSLVDEWKLSDKGVEEDGYLLQCNHCKAVFCSTCYLKNIFKVGSQQIPDCPGCGKQMSGEQYMNVFAPDPPIQVGVISIENILAENVNERQSHLHAKVKIIFEIKKIIVPENPYASKSMELGDRGIIECEFSNVAVRIGEKWYLLAVPQSEVVST
jgi:hypothetical protein